MSIEENSETGANTNPEFIVKVQKRFVSSRHQEVVRQFLQKQFYVDSIDELLLRRGVYSAVAQVDLLLDSLEEDGEC